MNKEIVTTGKTVEEAIEKALELLNAVREEVDIEILTHEKKGVLGIGSADAKVKVSINSTPISRGEAYLCQILNGMGIEEYDVAVNSDEDMSTVTYSVTSDGDVGFVIGYHGDVLDSLSTIVSLAVNKDSDTHIRVWVDLNGYREKRIESLKEYAQKAIKKAREIEFVTVANPMKPFERMIIHTEVQEALDVVSWSEGDEPQRRIIIAPLTKVKKVGDHYERTDRNRNDYSRDNNRGGGGFRGNNTGSNSGGGGFRGNNNSFQSRDRDRKGGGSRPPKYTPAVSSDRPAKNDFNANLYGKIDISKKDD